MIWLRRVLIASSLSVAAAGCYAPGADVSLSPDLDRSSLHVVAVRPFGDRGHLPAAGVTLSRAFEAAFLERGVRVVPYDRVRESLARDPSAEENFGSGDEAWSARAWRRVHEETGVDAVLTGTVTASEVVPGGFPPYLIECGFRLVEASGGGVLASGNANEDGGSPSTAASQLARRVLARFLGEKPSETKPSAWETP
jgi:hypothetical protein